MMYKQSFLIAFLGLLFITTTLSFPLSPLSEQEDLVMELRPGSKPAPIPPNSPAGKGLSFNPNQVKRFINEDLDETDDLVMELRPGSKPAPIPPNSPAGKGLSFKPNQVKRLVNDEEDIDNLEDFDNDENEEDLVMELRPGSKPAPIPPNSPAGKAMNKVKRLVEDGEK